MVRLLGSRPTAGSSGLAGATSVLVNWPAAGALSVEPRAEAGAETSDVAECDTPETSVGSDAEPAEPEPEPAGGWAGAAWIPAPAPAVPGLPGTA